MVYDISENRGTMTRWATEPIYFSGARYISASTPDGKAHGNTLTSIRTCHGVFYQTLVRLTPSKKLKQNKTKSRVLLVKIPHAFAPFPLPPDIVVVVVVVAYVCVQRIIAPIEVNNNNNNNKNKTLSTE